MKNKLVFTIPQQRELIKCDHINLRTDMEHIEMLNAMIKDTGFSTRVIMEKCIEFAFNNYEVKRVGDDLSQQ